MNHLLALQSCVRKTGISRTPWSVIYIQKDFICQTLQLLSVIYLVPCLNKNSYLASYNVNKFINPVEEDLTFMISDYKKIYIAKRGSSFSLLRHYNYLFYKLNVNTVEIHSRIAWLHLLYKISIKCILID